MDKKYQVSLRQAEHELTNCEIAIQKLEKERAKLRQIVAVLRAKLNMEQLDNPKTLTDAILLVIKATRDRECITASDVVSRLGQMQVAAKPRSVATILSRLASGRERLIDAWRSPVDGSVGYEWRGSPRSRSEQMSALKAIVGMNKIGLGRNEDDGAVRNERRLSPSNLP